MIALDDLSTGKESNISDPKGNKSFRFMNGIILDEDLLSEEMKRVTTVLHEAAIPSIQRLADNPRRTNQENVSGTLEVLIAAKNAGIKKLSLPLPTRFMVGFRSRNKKKDSVQSEQTVRKIRIDGSQP